MLLLTTIAVGSTIAAVRIDRAWHREQVATEELHREAARAAAFADRAETEPPPRTASPIFSKGCSVRPTRWGWRGSAFNSGVDHAAELTAVDVLRQGAKSLGTDLRDQPIVKAKLMAVIGSVYVTMGMLRQAQPSVGGEPAHPRRVVRAR